MQDRTSFLVNEASAEARAHWVEVPREYNAANHFIDRHVIDGRGAKIAYRDDRGSYSYAQLAERVNRAGNVLKGLGVEMEQRVLLCVQDGIDFVALYWGAIKIGAVPVPVNTLLAAADYDFMLRDCRAKVIAVSQPVVDRFAEAIAAQPFLQSIVVTGAEAGGGPGVIDEAVRGHMQVASFDELAAGADTTLETAATVADDVAFWLYSSGSTGRPKGVLHVHRSLVQTAALYAENLLGMNENDVVFSASKMFFAYGLGNAMSFPLHVGATAVLMAERPTPAAVMRMLVAVSADGLLRGADVVCGNSRGRDDRSIARIGAAAHLHVGGRGAARADRATLGRTVWSGDPRRPGLDRGAAYLSIESGRGDPLRQFGATGAGI